MARRRFVATLASCPGGIVTQSGTVRAATTAHPVCRGVALCHFILCSG
jgi:hypothetical protein